MKKTLVIALIVAAAVGLVAAGAAFAQGNQPPVRTSNPGGDFGHMGGYGPMMGADGDEGPMHDAMVEAFADALGIPADELESRHDAGESMYDIALSEGFTADEFYAIMADARSAALEAAVADGTMTQEQADWMNSRGAGHGGYGAGTGECDGSGHQAGSGMGGYGGGGRWAQSQAAP